MNRVEINSQPVLQHVQQLVQNGLLNVGLAVRQQARDRMQHRSRPKRYSELTDWERRKYDRTVLACRIARRPVPPIWFRTHSRPGEAPFTRRGNLPDRIEVAYDPVNQSIVIGPTTLPGRSNRVPQILEEGGRIGRATIAPRPYMRPAFQQSFKRFPQLFARG